MAEVEARTVGLIINEAPATPGMFCESSYTPLRGEDITVDVLGLIAEVDEEIAEQEKEDKKE